jgi:hypothetical protein
MYHGPWLQMSQDQLVHLINANKRIPRPLPFDPAVLHDILRIRVAVDEAMDFAVRAASGTVSAPSYGSVAAGKGIIHGAEALGLTFGTTGQTRKLTKERQYRMREMATQKLSLAYHLDEIATSVAAMQSATTVDDLARHVLKRHPESFDGNYVYFFHEKIPSRKIAEFTPLDTLDFLISQRPTDASPYRTRAFIKIFKEDFDGAIKDLTEGLRMARLFPNQHNDNTEIDTALKAVAKSGEAVPTSIQVQLLFHRANTHLQIASRNILTALQALEYSLKQPGSDPVDGNSRNAYDPEERRQRHLELRKIIKTNARKALRDYLNFLSHFEYTPEKPSEEPHHSQNGSAPAQAEHIFKAADLFASTPPASLHPYPPPDPKPLDDNHASKSPIPPTMSFAYELHDAVTFHPLLPEVLCSLLISHAILQTPIAEIRRHAHNAARLIRILGGPPVFALGRSSSGAVWAEILRATDNWLGLRHSWVALCGREVALYGYSAAEEEVVENSNGTGLVRRGEERADVEEGENFAHSLVRWWARARRRRREDEKEHAGARKLAIEVNGTTDAEHGETASTQQENHEDRGKENLVDSSAGPVAIPTADGTTAPVLRWKPDIPDASFTFSSTMVEPVAKWILFAPVHVEGEQATKKKKRRKKQSAATSLEEGVEQMTLGGENDEEDE